MKKMLLSAIVALAFSSADAVFAGAQKAVDQLNSQAPRQESTAASEAKPEAAAVVLTENDRPVRTIFFEADKANPIFDAIFGGANNNNYNGHGNNGYGNHGYGSYGRVSCVAQDSGWEEHWGGHGGGPSEIRACQECLTVHGSCRYSCSVQQFRCTAQFNPALPVVPPGQPVPPVPAPMTYTGDLRPDQGSAQDSAVLRCMQSSQGQQGYCSVGACNSESQVVNSGRCRN